jgi:hypothetical protein
MDWEALLRKEIPSPFVPAKGKTPVDTRNVSKEFLKMAAQVCGQASSPRELTPCPLVAQDTPTGPFSPIHTAVGPEGDHFQDFSYVESALE